MELPENPRLRVWKDSKLKVFFSSSLPCLWKISLLHQNTLSSISSMETRIDRLLNFALLCVLDSQDLEQYFTYSHSRHSINNCWINGINDQIQLQNPVQHSTLGNQNKICLPSLDSRFLDADFIVRMPRHRTQN